MTETDYWALDRAARERLEAGDEGGAARIWGEAVSLATPDRLGAYRHLARHQLALRDPEGERTALEGLAVAESSGQRRWWLPDLLFLAGVARLLDGDLVAADERMAAAYREKPAVDDESLTPRWARDLLAAVDTSQLPRLQCLVRLDPLRAADIDYDAALAAMPGDAHVLEVGAMDGVRFDRLYDVITARGWSATMVEPIADMHAALVRNYAGHPRVRCVRAAITSRSGEVTMLRVRPESVGTERLGEWAMGVSSLTDTLLRHYPDDVVAETVPALTFDDLVAQEGIERIDVLQIDTEGHDWEVLRQVDLRRWGPRVVRVELVNLQPPDRLAMLDALESAGYSVCFTGVDLTAVLPG